jgi:hypothetical protein
VVITSFERIILDALLAGRTPELAALRAQAEIATVERREMSGVGFFTTFAVSAGAVCLATVGGCVISDVGAEIEGVRHGASFALFIPDGRLDFLEGFTYDDPWPDDLKLRRWYYPTLPQGAS